MRISTIRAVGLGILSAALAFESAQAGQSAQADGQCQLINTQQGRDLYSGDCTITETVKNNGQMTVWDIRMGSAESFLFACQPNGDCMHGPDEVTFKDHGNSASFRWSNFRLEVQQETGAPSGRNAQGRASQSSEVSDAAESACMSAVNRNYDGRIKHLNVASSEFSQANSEVIINADGERWRCLVSNDGTVQDLSVQ